MSANELPDNIPGWMPTPQEIHAATLDHLVAGHRAPIAVMVYRAGLRAQIDVLRQAIYDCDINDAGSTVVFTGDLARRICDLAKELA